MADQGFKLDDIKLTQLAAEWNPFPILAEVTKPAGGTPGAPAPQLAGVINPVPPTGIDPKSLAALQSQMMAPGGGGTGAMATRAQTQATRPVQLPGITPAAPWADPRLRTHR